MKKILKNNYEDSGKFTWQELDCFYRAFANAIKGYGEIKREMFLLFVSFMHVYCMEAKYDFLIFNRNHPMFEFYKKNLQEAFGIYISEEQILRKEYSKSCLMKMIKKEIDEGNTLIVPGNLYKLYYSNAYNEWDDCHFFVVNGYDFEKKILYIVDNVQLELGSSTKYENFVVKIDDISECLLSYSDKFDDEKKIYFWSLRCEKSVAFEEVIVNSFKTFRYLLKDFVEEKMCLTTPETIVLYDIISSSFALNMREEVVRINLQ